MKSLKNMDVMQRSHTAKLEEYCHNIFTVARSVQLLKELLRLPAFVRGGRRRAGGIENWPGKKV